MPARRVRHHDVAAAEEAEDARRRDDGRHRVPLVEVNAARQDDDRNARERSGDEGPGVADDGRGREPGDLSVGNLEPVLDGRGEVAEARAEDDADDGRNGDPCPEELDGLGEASVHFCLLRFSRGGCRRSSRS